MYAKPAAAIFLLSGEVIPRISFFGLGVRNAIPENFYKNEFLH